MGQEPPVASPMSLTIITGGAVVHADTAWDLGQGTTCVTQSGGPPLTPAEYNSGLFIAQNPEHVLIETETGSEFRIIPIDRSPHPSVDIHQWHGDSRGHWEGDTLVVETTNFRPDHTYRNGDPNTQKITEYFKRINADTIEYKFTVDDPSTWTKPWSAIIPMSVSTGPLFEYDCSEDNNDAVNILAGRVLLRKGPQKAKRERLFRRNSHAPTKMHSVVGFCSVHLGLRVSGINQVGRYSVDIKSKGAQWLCD